MKQSLRLCARYWSSGPTATSSLVSVRGTLLGLWTWFAFGAVSSVGYCACLLLFLLTAPFDPNRRVTGTAIRWVGIAMVKCVPAWRFEYLEPVPRILPERCVCVSNHCSNLDPFLLSHLPWEMKYLAKDVLFKIPAVGWGIKIAGDIPLVRGSTRSIKQAMKKAGLYVRRGMPVCIFAEGTRSLSGDLLPFKDGAFRLAIDEQAHVLPIAVGGTAHALRKGDWRPGSAHGVILVGQPISAEGLRASDVPELKKRVWQAIFELREDLKRRGLA